MRAFKPGARVRVEHDATVIALTTKGNPYWYDVQLPTGEIETVNIARLNLLADEPICNLDADGSVQIVTTRLTPMGVLNLIGKLTAYTQYFPDESDQPQLASQE
jgi:ABC-type ATPase involved in cell division